MTGQRQKGSGIQTGAGKETRKTRTCGRIVLGVAAGPVVGHGVGKDAAVLIVGAGRDGLVALLHRLQPLLGVLQVG